MCPLALTALALLCAQDELSEAHEELGRAEALRDGELSELRAQHETHVDKIKAEAAHASEEVRASPLPLIHDPNY